MTKDIYINNRKKLATKLKQANYILIGGNALISKTADVNLPFRQDSNMIYLSGVKYPSSGLLIDVLKGKSHLVLPNLKKVQILFEGEPDYSGLLQSSGCNDVINYNQLVKIISGKKVFYNLPPKSQNWGLFANPFRRWLKNYLARYKVTFIDARPALAELRMVKQDYEIDNIKKAVLITKNALQKLEPMLWQANTTEQSFAWGLTAEFAKIYSSHAYPPIVAAGSNAAVLHHTPSLDSTASNRLVLVDTGAEYYDYCADITKTFTLNNDNIYNSLKQAQNRIIEQLKPGLIFKNIQGIAVKTLAEIAKANNINQPINELFTHAIGHHLGLDVHDAANYKLPLKEGNVITVEPGLYSKKYGFGYRVEDDVLITKTGAKVL